MLDYRATVNTMNKVKSEELGIIYEKANTDEYKLRAVNGRRIKVGGGAKVKVQLADIQEKDVDLLLSTNIQTTDTIVSCETLLHW